MSALTAVVKHAATLTLVCAALLATGCGAQNASGGATSRDCGENQFKCLNGECIRSELVCDGRADCSDQSDETEVECSKPELTCPDYAFRCGYGACVNGDATCNGVKDCLDNSDELLSRCPQVSASAAANSDESCGLYDHRCDNGRCINSTSLCDGVVDCPDGSDETYTACGSFPCNQIYFRCNYGACIDGDLSCNGVNNCADNSDEDPLLCNRPPGPDEPSGIATLPPRPTPRPTPGPVVTVPTQSPSPGNDCVTPTQPPNGQRKLHRDICNSNVDCDVPPGVPQERGSQLVYTCNPSFQIRGPTDVFCGWNGKWSRIPVCTEIRCNSLDSVTTRMSCKRSGPWTDKCDSALLPGTRARLSCRNGYKQDTTDIALRRVEVECNAAGKWEPNPIRCIPVCGRATTKQTPFIFNGVAANITEFPWHATLYMEQKGKKEFICGSTIIQTNLILTAAHCVYDETTRSAVDPGTLFVATGNIFRDYDSSGHNPQIVRKARVKKVYVHCQYYGFSGNYASDIAILELERAFVFSGILLPACLDVADNSFLFLQHGSRGKVAGFGRTELGETSGYLQTITVPFVDNNECKRSNVAAQNQIYLSADKFCAGFNNGTAVCDGDSGGGLVFEKNEFWFVVGIVSVGLGANIENGERTCDNNQYSLYTRVDKYIGWIQDVIYNLERYNVVQPCGA